MWWPGLLLLLLLKLHCMGPLERWRQNSTPPTGYSQPHLTLGACNPINFTTLDPEDPRWENDHKIGIHIHGQDICPRTILYLMRVTVPLWASTHKVFHSFYEEIESRPLPNTIMTRNWFLALAETIVQTLNVSCYVCGGNNMEDQWSWGGQRARSLQTLWWGRILQSCYQDLAS